MKHTHDYDNVFKTLKSRNKRLFIPVINEVFEKDYPMDSEILALPTEGFLMDKETKNGEKDIEEQDNDFLIRIGDEVFLLECQSYDDDSMAIRMAEYAFISARMFSVWDTGKAVIPMPHFAVIYVKRSNRTPRQTEITFTFPDGQEVLYKADNILLDELTKEHIMENRLFPYIPFYIVRYEKEISQEGDVSAAISDLEYFRDSMAKLFAAGELSSEEFLNLMGFVNTIITHITDGNKAEERLVSIMGGKVIETESERLLRIGREDGEEKGIRFLVETCQEVGLSITDTVEKLVSKFGLSEDVSFLKANQYWQK